LIVILLIVLFLFGGRKLPEIGAGLGKAIGSFKKGLNDVEEAVVDLKTSLPVVKEINEVKESLNQAGKITISPDK
jgi:Sec-independent protein secretion pathway components